MRILVTLYGALLIGAGRARACAVCFGNPESEHTQGMNGAILALLGVVGLVFVVGAVFVGAIAWRVARCQDDDGAPARDAGEAP